ncbi:SCP2 sterol-binding domain-containing protein [Pacificimonas sp. WHA3]|uniref:SCP2 sterol-binding domain-containing protein n=1 Tax=Pacificimonas pallii TaxID=2827236 RepID=A0ABS6SAG5_9SPHN|nr:SCP2 sterol-binding domain-containing protein [Pacificimonas pallii]MBV7255195.1 SCP2 sterol-binding domain-containing protein [Pacificimonas pallii]
MTLEEITQNMRERVGANADLNKSVKFDFGDEGTVRIDDTASPAIVDNEDVATDCTIKVSKDDFESIAAGDTNAQMAFMQGKLKVEGDMSVAMQLGKVFG